ncbi:MAG: adenylate/guanylate cyclase domain-containing protein [Paracoccaceae bacterium]
MQRSLAAVLAADVAGYSQLMGSNTEATLSALTRLRTEVFGPAVASRRGRVVKSMGDGWIVLFNAAADAAICALQIQDRLAVMRTQSDAELRLRLGVHLGDVIEQDDDIFGDGVNVASRLEELAVPGSIAISDAVFGSLDGTLRPSFDDAGERSLKNIDKPVRIWTRGSLPVPEAPEASSTERPRLIIRPIATTDVRDEVQELAEALTGDLLTYLGATHWLTVGPSETAGTSYELVGRLRGGGSRLRLEMRFADTSGRALWSSKIDGDLEDAFDWQDRSAETIVAQVLAAIFDTERRKLDKLTIESMTANQCELRGQLSIDRLDPEAFASALGYSSAAIEKDPESADALALALVAYLSATVMGYDEVTEQYAAQVPVWCAASLPLASDHALLSLALAVTSYAHNRDTSALHGEVTQALRQSSAEFVTLALSGWAFIWIGDPNQALDCLKRALTLGGHSPWALSIKGGLAMAYLHSGDDENALKMTDDCLKVSSGYTTVYRVQAAANAHLGRTELAHAAVANALRSTPGDSVQAIHARNVFADTPGTHRYLDGLRLAGMPQ